VRGRLDRRKGAFGLGRFELPVAICAPVWTVVALFVLAVPAEALVPVLIVVGLLVDGGRFFVGMLIFDRETLETEPRRCGRLPAWSAGAGARTGPYRRGRPPGPFAAISFHSGAKAQYAGGIDMQSQVWKGFPVCA
jgi:hypothetical protein